MGGKKQIVIAALCALLCIVGIAGYTHTHRQTDAEALPEAGYVLVGDLGTEARQRLLSGGLTRHAAINGGLADPGSGENADADAARASAEEILPGESGTAGAEQMPYGAETDAAPAEAEEPSEPKQTAPIRTRCVSANDVDAAYELRELLTRPKEETAVPNERAEQAQEKNSYTALSDHAAFAEEYATVLYRILLLTTAAAGVFGEMALIRRRRIEEQEAK